MSSINNHSIAKNWPSVKKSFDCHSWRKNPFHVSFKFQGKESLLKSLTFILYKT